MIESPYFPFKRSYYANVEVAEDNVDDEQNINNNNNNNNNKNSNFESQQVQKEYFLKQLGKQRKLITVCLLQFTSTTSSELLSSVGEFYFMMENIRTPSQGELQMVKYFNKKKEY
jgi:hypothetical protein